MWRKDLEEKYLERQRKEQEEDEKQRKELLNAIERYVLEKGFESDGKSDAGKLSRWREEKSTPLPKALTNVAKTSQAPF